MDARADFEDFHAEFVSQTARKLEKRLAPAKSVQIGATHADAMDAHQNFARARRFRRRLFAQNELLRRLQNQ